MIIWDQHTNKSNLKSYKPYIYKCVFILLLDKNFAGSTSIMYWEGAYTRVCFFGYIYLNVHREITKYL